MNLLCKYAMCFILTASYLYASDIKIDNLLEKAHQSKSEGEKKMLIEQLKSELAKVNKQAREESDAIIEAKKKIPTKLFDGSK